MGPPTPRPRATSFPSPDPFPQGARERRHERERRRPLPVHSGDLVPHPGVLRRAGAGGPRIEEQNLLSTVSTPRAHLGDRLAEPERAPGQDRPAPSRRVVWIARLVLVLVTVLLFLGLLEATLRMFGPILPGNYTSGPYLERHPIYGFFHIPGYEGWQHSSEYFARVRFNALGLRDPRQSYEKPPNTFRILLLGDSFMEAVQVEQRETTAAVVSCCSTWIASINESPRSRIRKVSGGFS